MINILTIASASAVLAGGLLIIPGQATKTPSEPIKREWRKIDQLPKQEGAPESRVVRVTYPSPYSAARSSALRPATTARTVLTLL